MLKIITLICALLGLFMAITIETWLRHRIVRNEATAETYATVRNRSSEFWSIQYMPLIILLLIVGTALYFGVGPLNAAVFLGGAVLCFVSVLLGSSTVVSGSIAPSSLAAEGDVRNALKTAYRSGSIMGFMVSSIALIGLGVLFFFLDTRQLINLIASFGLGASITSLSIGVSGTAFSGAYALTVKSDDFTDYTGMFIGSGADHVETYIMSACAAALLAGVAVDTSGVTSTFTATSAARYPLIVLASGIVASIIGTLTYRARIIKNPAAGITAGNYVAAVIIVAVAVYFSDRILQSYTYAYCVAAGIVAALLAGEVVKAYSSDGIMFKRHVPNARKVGASLSMIYSLSIGMISIVIPSALTIIAMVVSYNFASYYGIALAAVGINSMAGVNSAVRGFSINTASASEITSVMKPEEESPNPADVLLTASARTDVVGKTYSATATSITLVALFTALSVVTDNHETNMLTTGVFVGMSIGAVAVFLSAGLIIRSIRLTSYVLGEKLDNIYDDEKNIRNLRGLVPLYAVSLLVPLFTGFVGGVSGIIAFACSVTITGMCVLYTFNDSGKYFDRLATETLGTIIKLMVAVTLVAAPVFMQFGGIL